MSAAVYSQDRVRRLRLVLAIVLALGVLVALLAVLVGVRGGHGDAAVTAGITAGMLLCSSINALMVLPRRDRSAKVTAVIAGGICLLCGVALAGSWLAFLLPLLGLGLLFLALINDDPEAAS